MSFPQLSLQHLLQNQHKWMNRRATVRYQCAPATVGKVYPGDCEGFLRVWVLDLSRRGAGVQLNRRLASGQEVVLQIRSSAARKYEIPARVAHTAEQPNGDWLAGLEFVQPLGADELDVLLG